MLEAALDAHKFVKCANSKALVAVALHHHGRIKEALQWYEGAWRCPHEEGFEIDIGYSNALLFEKDKWHKAWPIVKQLKKRMVYALYLPFWDRQPTEKLSVVSEGGFGDLIQNCRWLPHAQALSKDITVYLPPYFFEHGFVDLANRQPWFPKIRSLLKLPQGVKAAGFFDLPALWDVTPDTIPDYPQTWVCDPAREAAFAYSMIGPHIKDGPKVGFCYAARAMETPLCPDGVYRSITKEQADSIRKTDSNINWFSLQKDENPALKSWEDTAALIANLDAVLTVDTAVFHLAAAMGKPTFLIISGAVDWKFGLSGDEAIQKWYPSVKLFRNKGFGMQDAVNQVIEFLERGGLNDCCYQTRPQTTIGQCSIPV
jgi:hypothetical protein